MSLTKLEMLIIRACKSQDPIKRLTSVYRRFYNFGVTDREDVSPHVADILGQVVDKYFPILPSRVARELLSNDIWYRYDSPTEKCVRMFMNRIRFERVDMCPEGMIWPKKYSG